MGGPGGAHLLEEGPEHEAELDQERGGPLPGEVLHEALQHQEGLQDDAAVPGVAAVQHVGLEEAELPGLRRAPRGLRTGPRRPGAVRPVAPPADECPWSPTTTSSCTGLAQ